MYNASCSSIFPLELSMLVIASVDSSVIDTEREDGSLVVGLATGNLIPPGEGHKKTPRTPRKTNMEPENEPLEEEIPIRNHHFQVPC